MSKDKHKKQKYLAIKHIEDNYNVADGCTVNIQWRPKITKLIQKLINQGKIIRTRLSGYGLTHDIEYRGSYKRTTTLKTKNTGK